MSNPTSFEELVKASGLTLRQAAQLGEMSEGELRRAIQGEQKITQIRSLVLPVAIHQRAQARLREGAAAALSVHDQMAEAARANGVDGRAQLRGAERVLCDLVQALGNLAARPTIDEALRWWSRLATAPRPKEAVRPDGGSRPRPATAKVRVRQRDAEAYVTTAVAVLHEGPQDAAQIRDRLGWDPRGVAKRMASLCARGVCRLRDDGTYELVAGGEEANNG